MNARKIMIANTRDSKKYTITSSATTRGELEADMRAAGIDFEGLSFNEGISQTVLPNADSVLPSNLTYKGQVTNDLIILLTNNQKNIKSGAYVGDRKEAYEIIKQDKVLADVIKESVGRNYTQVPTAKLWEFINDSEDNEENSNKSIAPDNIEPVANKKPSVEAAHPNLVNFIYDGVKMMASDGTLYLEDVTVLAELIDELLKRLNELKFDVSEEDIEDMLMKL